MIWASGAGSCWRTAFLDMSFVTPFYGSKMYRRVLNACITGDYCTAGVICQCSVCALWRICKKYFGSNTPCLPGHEMFFANEKWFMQSRDVRNGDEWLQIRVKLWAWANSFLAFKRAYTLWQLWSNTITASIIHLRRIIATTVSSRLQSNERCTLWNARSVYQQNVRLCGSGIKGNVGRKGRCAIPTKKAALCCWRETDCCMPLSEKLPFLDIFRLHCLQTLLWINTIQNVLLSLRSYRYCETFQT